jgi:hypothetical protein
VSAVGSTTATDEAEDDAEKADGSRHVPGAVWKIHAGLEAYTLGSRTADFAVATSTARRICANWAAIGRRRWRGGC